jgi:Putative metallopeptidase
MSTKFVFRAAGLIWALLYLLGSAAAQDAADKTLAFQQRVDEAARMMDSSPRLRDLSHERRRGIVQFVAGNMLFTLLHEMGHAHITEMGLPVLGREEDAADSFAVVTMLKVGSGFSHDVLVQATMGWFLSALRDEKEGVKLPFYDMHGLDRQRAFQIVCLMVGSDPDTFKDLAEKIDMPEERQSSCQGDYSNASWSWETVMKPHLRGPAQAKTKIETVYGKGEGELSAFEESFRTLRLLETVADQASEEFVWRRPFRLEMQSCGGPNAQWDLALRKLTLCYELAAEFAQLYRQYGERIALPRYYK